MKRECHVRFCEGGGVKIPSATRLVICCRYQAEEVLAALREVAGRIGLRMNEDKTHVCQLSRGRFDLLGYSFERCYSEKTGRSYLGPRPSKRSLQRMVESIGAQTERSTLCLDAGTVAARLNRMLRGGQITFVSALSANHTGESMHTPRHGCTSRCGTNTRSVSTGRHAS